MVGEAGFAGRVADVGGYPWWGLAGYGLEDGLWGIENDNRADNHGLMYRHLDPDYTIINPSYGLVRATAEQAVTEGYGGRFGLVVCTGVVEHAPNPFACIAALVHLAAPGGLIVLAAPFQWPRHGDPDTDFWRFSPDGLALALRKAGGADELLRDWVMGNGKDNGQRSMSGVVFRKTGAWDAAARWDGAVPELTKKART